MSEIVFSDIQIKTFFENTDFGEPINESVPKKRKFLAETLIKLVQGHWVGKTIYKICLNAHLIKDAKAGQAKELTGLGCAFLFDYLLERQIIGDALKEAFNSESETIQ